MPSIEANINSWNHFYPWNQDGDEWSEPWGGTLPLWSHTVYPRIAPSLPAGHILEIAPGRGRFTQFLASLCQELTLVDLNPACIEYCRERFKDHSHIRYFTNDGRRLDMVPSSTVDFVFSFDSLVHVEEDSMRSYIQEIGRILRPGGMAFIHHSNLAACRLESFLTRHSTTHALLARLHLAETWFHWRAPSVSADLVQGWCAEFGLLCPLQEILPWRTKRALIDAFTFLRKPDPERPVPPGQVRFVNRHFMGHAENIRRTQEAYSRLASPSA